VKDLGLLGQAGGLSPVRVVPQAGVLPPEDAGPGGQRAWTASRPGAKK
jgi:hypothetical protein